MPLDPLLGSGAYGAPGSLSVTPPLEAVIAEAPATLDDDVFVLTPGAEQRAGPCRWTPRIDTNGALLIPERGDPCVMQLANSGHQVITWWAPAAGNPPVAPPLIPVVTALPVSSADGDEVYLQSAVMAALTPPLMWHLRRVAGKWMPLGGAPWLAEIDAYTTLSGPDRTVSVTTYVALAVAGPSITLPAPGWYHMELSCSAFGPAGEQIAMSYDVGVTGAADADAVSFQPAVANTDVQRATRSYPRLFAAASVLTCKYRITAGTAFFRGSKTLKATPVLLG